jgi:hypothetical protein
MKCECASLKSSHLAITYFSCSPTTHVRGLFIMILNCALPLLFMWCCLVAQAHCGVFLMTFCCALLSSHLFFPWFCFVMHTHHGVFLVICCYAFPSFSPNAQNSNLSCYSIMQFKTFSCCFFRLCITMVLVFVLF